VRVGLFDIVQYEVQVFEHGHWYVRSRYPRIERERAFTEARRTDLNEGVPARVVRDVYDPQSGRNREITIFVSDRAKAIGPKSGNDAPASPRPGVARSRDAAHGAPPHARTGRATPLIFRATMALGVGLVTATLITAIAAWTLTPDAESFAHVLANTPAPGPMLPLFLGVMLFSVVTMLRGPLGISRLARAISAQINAAMTDVPSPPRRPAPAPIDRVEPTPAAPEALPGVAQVMLARFFTEAAPANTAKAMDDELGRRGLALYLSGAVSELAAMLQLPGPTALLAQIPQDALIPEVTAVLKEFRALDRTDAALVAAGRLGMTRFLTAPDARPSMATALVTWHKAARDAAQDEAGLPLIMQKVAN